MPLQDKTYSFNSELKVDQTRFIGLVDDLTIKTEPMFFNCEGTWARERGGEITKNFMRRLRDLGYDIRSGIFDSRVHMLMPGWYPCIPGWHHDDVDRSGREDGQPNYERLLFPPNRTSNKVRHVAGIVGATTSATEYLTGTFHLPIPPDKSGRKIYKEWNDLVDRSYRGQITIAPCSRTIEFDSDTLHRGCPSKTTGWRWFGRMSWNSRRVPTNEIRTQVQVYLPALNEGW